MKTTKILISMIIVMFMVSLFMCTQAEATVLTYSGWAGDNYNIGEYYDTSGDGYGSRISSSPVAYHEDTWASDISGQFTQGNGWTPNIKVAWTPPTNWQTYTGWSLEDVAQIDGSSTDNPLDLIFTPDAGYGVLINSFDLDEWAGGGGCVVEWEVFDDTGTLASGTWTGNDAGFRSTVNTGLTIGDMTIGNVVTLRFMQTSGETTYLAMDDTNFDQFGGKQAVNPSPANEAIDVPREVVLSWTPGVLTAAVNGHTVYLSESFNDVNDGIDGITLSATSYAPAQRLELGKTYYWRVDENSAPPESAVYPGDVWSFTTELIAYPVPSERITSTASSSEPGQGPENTVNDSGLDANDLHSVAGLDMWLTAPGAEGSAWIQYEFDKVLMLHEMWVWNHNSFMESTLGLGCKDVTIEYSVDGIDFTTLGTTHEFTQAPGAAGYAANTTIDFSGVVAKYVKLTINSNWKGILEQYGLSEVRFFSIPVHAREPYPITGATDVSVDVTLDWRAGREAAEHIVYLSTDEQAVIDGTADAETVTEPRYTPSFDLDIASTYYWRIDEVNDAETTTMWQGDIWNFTTQEYLVVDDFESYNDIDPPDPQSHTIFGSWSDGFEDATNGALVGHDPPQPSYTETVIVHGGRQAMPFFYSNTGGATYSEVERTFAVAQDWTAHGAKILVLWFYGTTGNTGQMYVKINGTKIPYVGDPGNIALTSWQVWSIDLASSGVNVQAVSSLAIGIDGNGAGGKLYFDNIRLHSIAPPATIPPTVWTEKASYSPNEPIVVHFTNAAGNSTDWVGFFVDGDASENYIDYIYLDGVIDGSVTYEDGLTTPGTYNVRLFFNDSYTVEASNVFRIE
jgi:hypothetical protein